MSRIKELEALVLRHKNLYYSGYPEISDGEYDDIEVELRGLDENNFALNLVGSTTLSTRKLKHDKKMLSLNKTYVLEDIQSWANDEEVFATLKVDGVSGSLIYEEGSLILGKTRGDGKQGEDITSKILWIDSVPKTIEVKDRVEIRGEIFCSFKAFEELKKEMEARDLEAPTNPRNIVAGLMGRKDNISLAKYLTFYAFDTLPKLDKTEDKNSMKLLKLGFHSPQTFLIKDIGKVGEALEYTKNFLKNGDYQIDGLVLSLNDISLHEKLGETAHHPRYKLAFKFAGDSKNTKIVDIHWGLSRNGILTPVAEVEPTELSGASITNVTLHNYGIVQSNELKKGDEIEIIRSGEVIPKFLRVVESSTNKFQLPTKCYSCQTTLEKDDVWLLCPNELCPGMQLEFMLYFVKQIGIDDLSDKRLEEMIKKEVVHTIKDLYLIEMDDLYKLDKVKEKLATKLYNSIQSTKKVGLLQFTTALGLAGGGINKCEKIIQAGYNTLKKFRGITQEQLVEIEGFAEKSATEILHSLDRKSILIDELLTVGMKVESVEVIKAVDHQFSAKKFCITGTLIRKRSEIEKDIKSVGGKVMSSVSKETDFLITNDGDSSSSKAKKARDLKIPIISENQFESML